MQAAGIMSTWMAPLKDRYWAEIANVDEDYETENEKLELDHEEGLTTGSPTQDPLTSWEVGDMIATEMENSASHRKALVLAVLVE